MDAPDKKPPQSIGIPPAPERMSGALLVAASIIAAIRLRGAEIKPSPKLTYVVSEWVHLAEADPAGVAEALGKETLMPTSKAAIERVLELESLSKSLRKASHLVQEAGAPEVDKWLRLELGGYYGANSAFSEDVVVPEYRTVVGQHADIYGRVLMLQADMSFVNETRLRNGVEELEELSTRNTVMIHDPQMCKLIKEHLQVDVYSFRFSGVQLKGVLSAIRSEMEDKLRKLPITQEQLSESDCKADEIFQLRPNFHGVGVDLKALWRRLAK